MGKKKDKGPKIPKHVAGVKVPKDLRKKGEKLIARAASPEGRAAIAKGLTVAATLANLAVERSAKAKADAPKPQPAASPANDSTPPHPPVDPEKIAATVSQVADAVLGRLFAKR